MAADTTNDVLRKRANRLYWTSAATVEDVAGELGMSRHALYAAVRPAPAGRACAECAEPLLYTNRSHRAASLATCSGCGVEVRLDDAAADDAVAVSEKRVVVFLPDERRAGSDGAGGVQGVLGTVPPRRVAAVAGALTLGALVGAVAARAAGRYA